MLMLRIINAKILYLTTKISSIYHQTNLCTTAFRHKSRGKSHLFKTFYQIHTAGKTLSCLYRKTGVLDNKNVITDNTGLSKT